MIETKRKSTNLQFGKYLRYVQNYKKKINSKAFVVDWVEEIQFAYGTPFTINENLNQTINKEEKEGPVNNIQTKRLKEYISGRMVNQKQVIPRIYNIASYKFYN